MVIMIITISLLNDGGDDNDNDAHDVNGDDDVHDVHDVHGDDVNIKINEGEITKL